MNGYVAMWQGKSIDVHADTLYQAQVKATQIFQQGTRKKVKGYEVSVYLAEKDGEQVVHVATF
jgi:hypothetical protein